METVFESKIRRVGSSMGLLIPKSLAREQALKEGKNVRVAILRKDVKAINEAFGSAKGAGPFERDHSERHVR